MSDCKSVRESGPLPPAAGTTLAGDLDAAPPAWTKAIAESRDRTQSAVMSLLLGGAILFSAAWHERTLLLAHHLSAAPLLLSCGFGLLAWRLRAATVPAAAMGAVICLALSETGPAGTATPHNPLLATPLHVLVTLFVITFLVTRFGRARKEQRGLAERRRGRRAAQVLANLGAAALFAITGHLLGALAAMAEATADTVSSEVGQALAGPTWLLTTGRRVPAGTDGGLSLSGTVAGCGAASLIAAVSCLTLHQLTAGAILAIAGCFGLAFDSLLGATLERRGWIGNDLVNLLSTVAAALCATALGRLGHAVPRALLCLLSHAS